MYCISVTAFFLIVIAAPVSLKCWYGTYNFDFFFRLRLQFLLTISKVRAFLCQENFNLKSSKLTEISFLERILPQWLFKYLYTFVVFFLPELYIFFHQSRLKKHRLRVTLLGQKSEGVLKSLCDFTNYFLVYFSTNRKKKKKTRETKCGYFKLSFQKFGLDK